MHIGGYNQKPSRKDNTTIECKNTLSLDRAFKKKIRLVISFVNQ